MPDQEPPATCEYGDCPNPPTVNLQVVWGGHGGNSPDDLFVCNEHREAGLNAGRESKVKAQLFNGEWRWYGWWAKNR